MYRNQCYSDMCSPEPLQKHQSVDICFHLQSLHLQILTVIEGIIVGLFFIQEPQEWMKANTKAFFNYTMFSQFLFWLSSPDVMF